MKSDKHNSIFIAFEGIDGSGKSTQLQLLAAHLHKKGYKVHTTAEPSGRPIGKMIRDIFNHRMEADNRTIAGLFVADRLDHILNQEDGMLKMLQEGYIVLTDRYYLSSYAYQGAHVDLDWVMKANSLAVELLKADLTIYIDMPVSESLERVRKSRNNLELFETEENIKKVSAMYEDVLHRVAAEENIIRINGNRDVLLVTEEIIDVVDQLISKPPDNTSKKTRSN